MVPEEVSGRDAPGLRDAEPGQLWLPLRLRAIDYADPGSVSHRGSDEPACDTQARCH